MGQNKSADLTSSLNTPVNPLYSKKIQTQINWFVLFLTFPAITLLGNSITFYIFLSIVVATGNFWSRKFKGRALFIAFFLIILISSALAPYSKFLDYPGLTHVLKFIFQYGYWISISVFFVTARKKINLFEISKWIFYGTVISVIGFYIVPFELEFPGFTLTSTISRNSFVFNLLCSIPFAFYYLSFQKKLHIRLAILFYLLVFLASNGRSGVIIGTIELLLISSILFNVLNKAVKFAIPLFIFGFIFIQSNDVQLYMNKLSYSIEGISPRMATLLRSEGEGDLTMDKSWLIRKLMIDKSQEIFSDYPVFGIGPNNFRFYESDLRSLNKYERLGNHDKNFYNTRSSHNSYVQILSETGLVGFIVLVLILGVPLFILLRTLLKSELKKLHLPLIAILGMSMHFYAITALTGAIPWLVIGIAWTYFQPVKNSA